MRCDGLDARGDRLLRLETSPATPDRSAAVQETFRPADQVAALRSEMAPVVRWGIAPGLVILIRHGGDQQILAGGVANVRTGARMTPGDRFRVASMPMSMVATVVMQLVQEGRVNLDDPVEEWLPGLLPGSAGVTLEQLLGHTSGLPEYEDLPAARAIFRHSPVDPRALVDVAARAHPVFAPGEGQHYSNTNYQILGLIIERVTGQSLQANLDHRIIGPLGMNSTSLSPSRWFEEPLAHGYVEGHDVSHLDLSPGWAAGGLVSDAADVGRFFRALFAHELVPRTVVEQMAAPVADDLGIYAGYGLGLGELTTPCGVAVGHLGAWDGYSSAAFTRRDVDREAVLLVNASRDLSVGPLRGILDTALCCP